MDNKIIVTPVGIASYPHLTRPDEYKGKEQYKCKLILNASNEDVITFKAEVEGFLAKAREEALAEAQEQLDAQNPNAKAPKAKEAYENALAVFEQVRDRFRSPITEEWGDDDTLTGNYILDTKSNAGFKDKKTGEFIRLEPKIWDATPKIMTVRPEIRGGSKLALEIILAKYFANTPAIGGGVSARIRSVQVIDLSGSGGSGTSGFGSHDGGFDGEDYVAPETPAVSPSEDSDDDQSSVY